MPEPSGDPREAAPLLHNSPCMTRDSSSSRGGDSREISHSHSSSSSSMGSSSRGHLHTLPPSDSNAASSSSKGSPETLGTCRICFETETTDSQDPSNPLICPCLCSGSSKYVHRQCLSQWRSTNHRADAFYQCEVCKYRYQYRRLWWAGILGSQVTIVVTFLVLMSALLAALGFVPVLSLIPKGSSSSSSGGGSGSSPAPGGGGSVVPPPPSTWVMVWMHVANGLIMMGVLGLLLSAVLGILRGCGYVSLVLLPDPFCPACLWCFDLNGGAGIGWAPFVECTGAAGECGVGLLVLLVVVMLMVGVLAAAYLVYGLLWALTQRALDKAMSMVENVQPQEPGPATAGAAAGASGAVSVAKR